MPIALGPIFGYVEQTLFYNKRINRMIDEYGLPVFDIFNIIRPNDLYMFKKLKEDVVVMSIDKRLIELVYSEEDDIWND
jgi:hypothetical protein